MFGKEIDKLEHANDDERTYYIIETDAVINKFISVPKDKGSLNCAIFTAGIIESVLCLSGFVSILNFFIIFLVLNHYLNFPDMQGNSSFSQRYNLYGEI